MKFKDGSFTNLSPWLFTLGIFIGYSYGDVSKQKQKFVHFDGAELWNSSLWEVYLILLQNYRSLFLQT